MDNNAFTFFRPARAGEMLKMSTTLTSFPFDVATMMEIQRKNIQAAATLQQLMMESMGVIAHRQSALIKDMTNGMADMVREWNTHEPPTDKIGDQALLFKTVYDRTVSHMREISDMMAQSGHETQSIIHARVGASLVGVKDSLDRAKSKRASQ